MSRGDGLLRHAWRRLPRPARQRLYGLYHGLALDRARPVSVERLPEPVVVAGVLRAPTGLGQAARLASRALQRQGVATAAIDLTEALLQPATEPVPEAQGARSGPGTLLVYLPPPALTAGLAAIPRAVRQGKCVVAGWVCETQALTRMWREQAAFCHVLTAPSRFAADAIAKATGRPVALIGHPVAVEAADPPVGASPRRRPRIGAVLDVGSSSDRKDIGGLLETLRLIALAEPNLDLAVKARDLSADLPVAAALRSLTAIDPARIETISRDASRADTIEFIDGLDLLLSLSRAEGFGLPHAEAVLRGIKVAAPFWGGPTDFLTDANAIALPFTLTSIQDRSGLYTPAMGRWASVDPEAAAQAVLPWLRSEGWRVRRPSRPASFEASFFVDALMAAGRG